MTADFSGASAVVVGGASGMGAATARLLADRGAIDLTASRTGLHGDVGQSAYSALAYELLTNGYINGALIPIDGGAAH